MTGGGRSAGGGGQRSTACLASVSSSVVDVLPTVKHIFLFLVWFFTTFIFVQKKKHMLPGAMVVFFFCGCSTVSGHTHRLEFSAEPVGALFHFFSGAFTAFSLFPLCLCDLSLPLPELAFPESPVSALQALIGWDVLDAAFL